MQARRNQETARLIDASIEVMGSHGIYVAARLLCEHGVPLETVWRVLREPARRRPRRLPANLH